MKKLIVLLAVAGGFSAQAKVVTCNFTEPFFTVVVNEETKVVRVDNIDDDLDATFTGEFSTGQSGVTRVVYGPAEGEKTVLEYVKDYRGSDGMSDLQYPYSATAWVSDLDAQYGGCYTPDQQPEDPNEESKD